MSTPLQTSARAATRTQASARRDAGALDRETMIVASVVLLGAVMSILDTTVVNVAINRLAIDFNASLTTIQWVVTGYTLALAAVIPVTGWAADRFGTKRIYLTSLALFMLGSILCAVAWSAGSLIAFRVLQGARRRHDHAGGHDDHDQEGRSSPDGTGDGHPRRADARSRRSSGRSSAAGSSTTSPGAGSS